MEEEPIQNKMQEFRMICEREIPLQEQRARKAAVAFRNSLQSIKLTAEQTAQDQEKLGKLKAQLRELEDDLVKAIAVKTHKEAKRITISDSISAAKAKTEELKRILHDRKQRKDEYAEIMSQQALALATLEEKVNQGIKDKEDTQEAISWYNRVLGLRIEGGRRGLNVIFNNINTKVPNEEYSFAVRLAHDIYSLLNCDPHLEGTEELVQELNRTNGFFKFVRVMREKFQAAASFGITGSRPQHTSTQPESSTVSMSAPTSPVSVNGNESLGKENVVLVQTEEGVRSPRKADRGQKGRSPGSSSRSPKSASSIRRSSRLKAKEVEN